MSDSIPRDPAPEPTAGRGGGERFPRAARLTRPADYKRVFEKARTSGNRTIRILARRGIADRSRLGMAVSRRVDRKASGRNRIKRVVRESFRRHFGNGGPFASTAPLDLVVLPQKGCASISNAELTALLDTYWKRIVAQFEPREDPPA